MTKEEIIEELKTVIMFFELCENENSEHSGVKAKIEALKYTLSLVKQLDK